MATERLKGGPYDEGGSVEVQAIEARNARYRAAKRRRAKKPQDPPPSGVASSTVAAMFGNPLMAFQGTPGAPVNAPETPTQPIGKGTPLAMQVSHEPTGAAILPAATIAALDARPKRTKSPPPTPSSSAPAVVGRSVPKAQSSNAPVQSPLDKLIAAAQATFESSATTPIPSPARLPAAAAIIAGVLAGLSPERFQNQIRPELDKFRAEPLERFKMEQEQIGIDLQRQASKLSMIGAMGQLEVQSNQLKDYDRTRQQLIANTQGIFDATPQLVQQYVNVAQEFAKSESQAERLAGTQIMGQLSLLKSLQDSIAESGIENVTPQTFEQMTGILSNLTSTMSGIQSQKAGFEAQKAIALIHEAGADRRAQIAAAARTATVGGKRLLPATDVDKHAKLLAIATLAQGVLDDIEKQGGVSGGPFASPLGIPMTPGQIKFKGRLQMTQAVIRNLIYGSAFTSTEAATADTFIASFGSWDSSVISSLTNIRDYALTNFDTKVLSLSATGWNIGSLAALRDHSFKSGLPDSDNAPMAVQELPQEIQDLLNDYGGGTEIEGALLEDNQ